jgi:hypothetical protein
MTMNVREAAMNLLVRTFREDGYSNYLFETAIVRHPEWTEVDRGFL